MRINSFFWMSLFLISLFSCKQNIAAKKEVSFEPLSEANLFSSPVERYGKLSIQGANLTSECGKPLQLAGMSLFWHEWQGKEIWNKEAFKWLRDDWKIQYLRAPLGIEMEGNFLEEPERGTLQMREAIEAAIDSGIYLIIDWHAHDIHLEEAKRFFAMMAKDYGRYPNIIYEIFNEPTGRSFTDVDETWPEIKAYAQELIKTIREHDPDNIIIVPTPFWDQLTNLAADDPILKDSDGNPVSNIAYTLHFYAGGHKEDVRSKAEYARQKNLPLWITECGRVGTNFAKPRALNANPPDIDSWNEWITWVNKHNLSYSKWSLSTKDEQSSSLLPHANPRGNWTLEDLTEEGKWNRQHFRDRFERGWTPACNQATF